MEYWLRKIRKHADEHAEIILIGNKRDLINDVAVQAEEVEELCKSNGMEFFEASAKDASNVDKAFKYLLSNILSNEHLKDKITVQQTS